MEVSAAALIHELNTRICKLSLFDTWDGGGGRGVRGGGGRGAVNGGGKKPKESGVKFDAEIPSQIPRPAAAVGQQAAAVTTSHSLERTPLSLCQLSPLFNLPQ